MGRIGKGLLVVVAALAFAAPAFASRGSTSQSAMQSLAGGVLVQLNQIRTEHGLAPLSLDAQLTAAAAQHTSEMLKDGYFAHNSFDGGAFWKRLTAYTSAAPDGGWSVGENLLWSSPGVDPTQALALWMASPDHRANILTAKWRQVGISAMHSDAAPGTYENLPVTVITTDFGTRS